MRIGDLVRERGPMTVAAFMDLALYEPGLGYYARAAQRSGRAGDFFTSVDVGPEFGELLAVQVAEMASILDSRTSASRISNPESHFDLVEAAAGNGRLSADILRPLRRRHPELYQRLRLHLVEASEPARAAQPAALGEVADRLAESTDTLPASIDGVVIANELIDALPVHQVVMREEGLREVYVRYDGELMLVEDEPSTPALQAYLDRLGVSLEPGWRVEINLRAVEWMRETAKRLTRGFVILIDYGHEARELYSATHSSGTLTTFARHTMAAPSSGPDAARPAWLLTPGDQDMTAHVDFTSLRAAAEAEGLTTIGFLDQTYLLLGLLEQLTNIESREHENRESPADLSSGATPAALRRSLAIRTLLMPGNLGSTHKVLILGKGVGTPRLAGCSFGMRVT